MLDRLVEWIASGAVKQSERFQSYEAKAKLGDSFLSLSNTLFGGALLALLAMATKFGDPSVFAFFSIFLPLVLGECFRRAGLRIYDAAAPLKIIEKKRGEQ